MKPSRSNLPLDELDVIQVFWEGMRLYWQHGWHFLGVAALVWLPLVILQVLLLGTVGRPVLDQMAPLLFLQSTPTVADIPKVVSLAQAAPLQSYFTIIGALGALESIVVLNLAGCALVRSCDEATRGKRLGVIAAYSQPVGRYLSAMIADALSYLVVLLPCAALVGAAIAAIPLTTRAPGGAATAGLILVVVILLALVLACVLELVVFTRFYLTQPVIVVEQRGPLGALRGSWTLSRGRKRTLAVFGVAILFALLSFVASFFLSFVARDLLQRMFGDRWGMTTLFLISHFASQLTYMLVLPLRPIASTLVYSYLATPRPEVLDARVNAPLLR